MPISEDTYLADYERIFLLTPTAGVKVGPGESQNNDRGKER
jgi:hypothetical protein